MFNLGVSHAGKVNVMTSDKGGLTNEQVADLAVDKIVSISDVVPATPVGETKAVPTTDSSPKPIVPVNPVSVTLAPAAAKTSPTAVVPTLPVTEKIHVPVTVTAPTAPVPTAAVGTTS